MIYTAQLSSTTVLTVLTVQTVLTVLTVHTVHTVLTLHKEYFIVLRGLVRNTGHALQLELEVMLHANANVEADWLCFC